MKRLISMLLVLVMLCSMIILCERPAVAANTENLCPVFYDQLSIYCSSFGLRSLDKLNAYVIAERVRWILFEQRGISFPYITDEIIVISKVKFEALAAQLFDLKKTFAEYFSEYSGSFDCCVYPDGDNYLVKENRFGPVQATVYEVRGYTEANGMYTVYFQGRDWFLPMDELEYEKWKLKHYAGWTDQQIEANIIYDGNGNFSFWGSTYFALRVTYNGTYVKIYDCKEIDKIPAVSGMIVPKTGYAAPETTAPVTAPPVTAPPVTTPPVTTPPVTTPPVTTPPETTPPETTAPETTAPETTEPETTGPASAAEVIYDVPAGVKVAGGDTFPAGTVVKVDALAKGEIYKSAAAALKTIASDGKIAVYEFTATADGAAVQPDGTVKVTFAIPENLSADNLKLYYIAADGTIEAVDLTVDKENNTATASLTHFSTYALANVIVPSRTNVVIVVLLIVACAAVGSTLAVLAYRKKHQEN